MAAERLPMRQIREILRQKWALRLSHRAVAGSLGVGLGTISSVVTRAQAAGLDWAQIEPLTETVLESRLYGRPEVRASGNAPGQTARGFTPTLAHQACRQGYRAYYRRASRLFHDLTLARADGTYIRLLAKLARLDVLVLDDWGLAPVQDQERRDLLEILEDRYGSRSTIITSQLPPAQWHDYLGEATLADAICDRLLHNAHRIVLKGPSRRKEAKLDS
jgi:hypothetical protein